MTADLFQLFETLLLPLESPAGRSLSAVPIPGAENHRLAKDSTGSPCLLLRQSVLTDPTLPIRLQNLLVTYGVRCQISHPNGEQEQGSFTIIKCSSPDPSLFPHFLKILSPIITTLGSTPTAAAVRRAIAGLVALFQALTTPAKKSIQGLWAELVVIRIATDPVALVAAWHGLPTEHIDFLAGRDRIEVKSSSTRRRLHHFSLLQLIPPAHTRLVIASLFAEPAAGGLSLRQLSDEIRAILAVDEVRLSHFDAVFYATLGSSWSEAMEEHFDFELARDSLQFFDSIDIPRVPDPIPSAVSDVRFTSDISAASPLTRDALRAAGTLFTQAVPTA